MRTEWDNTEGDKEDKDNEDHDEEGTTVGRGQWERTTMTGDDQHPPPLL